MIFDEGLRLDVLVEELNICELKANEVFRCSDGGIPITLQ